jgi:hypothetical protein
MVKTIRDQFGGPFLLKIGLLVHRKNGTNQSIPRFPYTRRSSGYRPAVYPSICVSPQIEIACPEIVLPRGLHINRI